MVANHRQPSRPVRGSFDSGIERWAAYFRTNEPYKANPVPRILNVETAATHCCGMLASDQEPSALMSDHPSSLHFGRFRWCLTWIAD